MKELALILLGLGEGVVVGAAVVAFLLVLDIIPRLIRFGGARKYVHICELLIVAGIILAINFQFYRFQLPELWFFNSLIVVGLGLVFGMFIGLIAGALTETLQVLPILGRRLGLNKELRIILITMMLGKTIGSLLYWLFPELWP